MRKQKCANIVKAFKRMNEEEKKYSAKETLDAIQATIKNSDEKAVALLTATGILFGLSAFSLDALKGKTDQVQKVFINIFGCAYLVCFVALITLLVLTIFPRRKKTENINQIALRYKNYGEDVQRAIDDNKLEELLYKEPSLAVLESQIIDCSRISKIKATLLRVSVCLLIGLTICLAALILLGSI